MYIPHDMQPSMRFNLEGGEQAHCSNAKCHREFPPQKGVAWVCVSHETREEDESPLDGFIFCSMLCLLKAFNNGGHG